MKYSVIVPAYNAEKTLRRCVDSLLSQERSDVEIILINDGSQDGSETICEDYAEKYESIRYISQQNAGVSAARNRGLDAAKGEFVLFVDSDDYVVRDFFTIVDGMIAEKSADLIQFSACVDNGYEKHPMIHSLYSAFSREKLFPHIIDAICRKTINAPHAKLFKREIIENNCIRFPKGVSVAEDRAFNIVYSFYINSYTVSDAVVYVINTENGNSLSRKRHEDLKKQLAAADAYIDGNLASASIPEEEKELYRKALNFGMCRSVYHDARLMLMDGKGWLSRQKELRRLCRQINIKRMKYPKTLYCTLISLTVRLYLTTVIDAVAMKLNHDLKKR